MEIVIKNNVEYILQDYKIEEDFEKIVFKNYKNIFGNDTILLPKQKIMTRSGIGTIPDGYLLSIKEKKWCIIEVELESHPLHEHIVAQISKFSTAIKNTISREELKKAFYEEITRDSWKNNIFKDNGITEIFKYISDIMESTPEIVIFIDKKSIDLDDVCKDLPFYTRVVTFKTYCIEGTVEHIYQIDGPLKVSVRDSDLKNVDDIKLKPIVEKPIVEKIEIFATYKNELYKATYYSQYNIIYNGTKYKSPSAACSAITELNCNGWKFWNFKDENGLEHSLDELRRKITEKPFATAKTDNNYNIIKQKLDSYKKIRTIYQSPNNNKMIWSGSKKYNHKLIGQFPLILNTFESIKDNDKNVVIFDCRDDKKFFIIPIYSLKNILRNSTIYDKPFKHWKIHIENYEDKFYINLRGNKVDITCFLNRKDLI